MRIHKLVVTIEPMLYAMTGERFLYEITATLFVDGKQYRAQDALPCDDLHSRYEMICKRLLEKLGDGMKEIEE